MRSAWPVATISSTCASLISVASWSRRSLPESLSSALLKSNSTSVDSASFWITGRGGSGAASGAGAGAACATGAGWTTATGGGTEARAMRSQGSAALAGTQWPARTHCPKPLSTTLPSEDTTYPGRPRAVAPLAAVVVEVDPAAAAAGAAAAGAAAERAELVLVLEVALAAGGH